MVAGGTRPGDLGGHPADRGLRRAHSDPTSPMPDWHSRPLVQRFQDAGRGLCETYAGEPNLRFHLFAGSAILALAVTAGVARLEGLYLLGTIFLVLLAEALNTALERAVDFTAAGAAHALARQAKDAAAGAVLISVIHAGIAGFWVFLVPDGPGPLFQRIGGFAVRHPMYTTGLIALVSLMAILGMVGGRRSGPRHP